MIKFQNMEWQLWQQSVFSSKNVNVHLGPSIQPNNVLLLLGMQSLQTLRTLPRLQNFPRLTSAATKLAKNANYENFRSVVTNFVGSMLIRSCLRFALFQECTNG